MGTELPKLRILFVCVGNSCRSPMAESVLKSLLKKQNSKLDWVIDSAAIADWNVGLCPEERCIAVLAENELSSDHIARQISKEDFYYFDYVFGMDDMNVKDLNDMKPLDGRAKIELLGKYDYGKTDIIVDPYFQRGIHGFRTAYDQILRSCQNFVKHITEI